MTNTLRLRILTPARLPGSAILQVGFLALFLMLQFNSSDGEEDILCTKSKCVGVGWFGH